MEPRSEPTDGYAADADLICLVVRPTVPGLHEAEPWTSDTIWELAEIPAAS